MAPYRAILRYYRCDTPYRAILFQGGLHSPKMVRYPPLVLSFTEAHLCDTPFCNVSRENCAIPHKKQARKSFAILSLQVSRDMKSIATGPLSFHTFSHFLALFQNFSPRTFHLKTKGFSSRRTKEKKKIIKRNGRIDVALFSCCTFVLLLISWNTPIRDFHQWPYSGGHLGLCLKKWLEEGRRSLEETSEANKSVALPFP